jgi:membrane protein implicated in regulation of membrane protease activity
MTARQALALLLAGVVLLTLAGAWQVGGFLGFALVLVWLGDRWDRREQRDALRRNGRRVR